MFFEEKSNVVWRIRYRYIGGLCGVRYEISWLLALEAMSFISCHLITTGIYELTDSEFGRVHFAGGYYSETVWPALIKEYVNRNLPVGKNLALYAVWFSKCSGGRAISNSNAIKAIITEQNMYCHVVYNWKQYAKERDEYFDKILCLL